MSAHFVSLPIHLHVFLLFPPVKEICILFNYSSNCMHFPFISSYYLSHSSKIVPLQDDLRLEIPAENIHIASQGFYRDGPLTAVKEGRELGSSGGLPGLAESDERKVRFSQEEKTKKRQIKSNIISHLLLFQLLNLH